MAGMWSEADAYAAYHGEGKYDDPPEPETDRAPDTTPELDTWCFTFGVGSPLARYYVAIDAPDETTARQQMIRLFSRHWAGCYRWDRFQVQIAQYGYERLQVNPEASVRLGTNEAA